MLFRSYLARIIEFNAKNGITDLGFGPLHQFVDSSGEDAVAVTVETDDTGEIHPAVYVRRGGKVDEHLLPSDPLLVFRSMDHKRVLNDVMKPLGM